MPWYVAGPIIGFMVPMMLMIGNRSFGVSSNLRHLCAISQPKWQNVDFFNYNWKEQTWSLMFAGGAILGGFLAGYLWANPEPVALSAAALEMFREWGASPVANELVPDAMFALNPPNIVLLFIGGVFVGFGTRYANGCTSGHAITGLSTLQPESLIAVIGIFGGGAAASWLLTPFLI
jgi:uncharacterized membrane protein YedE/YeeE